MNHQVSRSNPRKNVVFSRDNHIFKGRKGRFIKGNVLTWVRPQNDSVLRIVDRDFFNQDNKVSKVMNILPPVREIQVHYRRSIEALGPPIWIHFVTKWVGCPLCVYRGPEPSAY